MSLRARILIIITCGVLLILAVTVFLLRDRLFQKKLPANQTPTSSVDLSGFQVIDSSNFDSSNIATIPTVGAATNTVPAIYDSLAATKNGVKQLAKVFIERYGSYSTDNSGQNILEVRDLVTPELWGRLKSQIPTKKADQFLGVTTQVVQFDISSWSENQAEVKLQTQRTEEKNNATSILQQPATVGLIKQGNTWLINRYAWQ